jgi:ribosomal-protein-alanine N-acetyltransferase
MFLQTARTSIRPLVPQDLDKLHRLCASPEAMKFIPPHFAPETIKQTKDRLNHYIEHHDEYGISFGYVSDKQGKFMGRAGFYFIPEVNLYEIGYSLLPEYWGQGYATELAAALLDYAFNTLSLDTVCARTIHGNDSSEKVLHKTGFIFLGERMFSLRGEPFFWHYYECSNDNNLSMTEQYSEAGSDDWAI